MIPETHYARSGGAHIAYQVVGDGPVDVLLAPHFFQHLELWWECRHRCSFTEALVALSRVILLDKRGTGLSDRTCGVPPFDVQMDDVRAVLDAAGVERAVLWAGGDATPMLLLFAATYPDRVRGLVLWDPHPTFLRNPEMPWLMTRAEFDDAVRETAKALEDREASFLVDAAPSLTSAEERRLFWRVSRLGTSPGDHLAFTGVLAETDVRHVLPAIHAPSLVLTNVALADRHESTQYVADRLPRATLSVLPGVDRLMLACDPAPIMGELQSFLERLRETSYEEADRVLATVLFTDIVGSTEKAVTLGDRAWRDLVERHHGVVRSQLARFRRQGDRHGRRRLLRHVRRAGAGDPLRARDLRIHPRPRSRDPSRATHGRGGAGRGPPARHRCPHRRTRRSPRRSRRGARLEHGQGLVAGAGIEFDDRGTAELRGVPGEWRLYAVR